VESRPRLLKLDSSSSCPYTLKCLGGVFSEVLVDVLSCNIALVPPKKIGM
jgi:hypothetical protein